MLDFHKLIMQIEQVGKDSLVDKFPFEQIVLQAEHAYVNAGEDSTKTAKCLEQNQSLVLWPVALPLEPFGKSYELKESRQPVTVVATDGSQIMPSHHEVHSCYVLNIGKVVISYGSSAPPILDSQPRLYHRPEDLYPLVDRRRLHIDELYVSLERNLLELEELCELALNSRDRGLPVVALLDGTLIPWSVEKMSESYQATYLKRILNSLENLRQAKIPLIGYLSHSRAADLVNDLRVTVCPYPLSQCRDLCGHLNEEDFPCSKIWPLTDRQLLSTQLQRCHRTAAYLSGASVSKLLPDKHKTCFSYLHVGSEVARLEFPRWVFDDLNLLELAFETTLAQVSKGMGYPVSLSEAHNLAVIKGADRSHFFDLLTKQLLSLGLQRVSVSPKESRKRKGVV